MDPNHLARTLLDAQPAAQLQIDWAQFGALISAVGALGFAAFGVVEALGKACTIVYTRRDGGLNAWLKRNGLGLLAQDWLDGVRWGRATIRFGLPYVGFAAVRRMARPLAPALECAYGLGYLDIISQQYRADRSSGRAPDTIREGVKLGLPFLSVAQAARVIGQVWHMEQRHAVALATALRAEPAPETAAGTAPSPDLDNAQLLAGRFATALDERVNAAFSLAEERYQASAKMLAGVTAVALALIFNLSLSPRFSWWTAALVGVVAVPLAPVAKDLSTSLQNALTAFKSIPTRRA